MNISKSFSIMALACALTFGAALTCEAADVNSGQIPGYGRQITPDQAAQAKQAYADNLAKMDSARKQLTVKRAELGAELSSMNPDTAKIESLSREIGELRGKLLSARAELRSKLQGQELPDYGPMDNYDYGTPPPPPPYGYNGWRHHGHGHGWGPGPRGCYWPGMMGMGCWW